MTFIKDQTGVAQTAANVAGGIVGSFVEMFGSFDEAVEAFDTLRADLFKELAAVVDADNAKFAAEDGKGASNGSSKASARSSKTASSGGSKPRSGGSKGGGGGSTLGIDDSLSMQLTWGAFEGETLAHVLALDAQQCDEDYNYGEGERNGRDYIAWLASDSNKIEFVQRRARVIADAEGLDY